MTGFGECFSLTLAWAEAREPNPQRPLSWASGTGVSCSVFTLLSQIAHIRGARQIGLRIAKHPRLQALLHIANWSGQRIQVGKIRDSAVGDLGRRANGRVHPLSHKNNATERVRFVVVRPII